MKRVLLKLSGEALAGDAGKGLAGSHDIEILIGCQMKHLEDAVQHLAVLGGDAADACYVGRWDENDGLGRIREIYGRHGTAFRNHIAVRMASACGFGGR